MRLTANEIGAGSRRRFALHGSVYYGRLSPLRVRIAVSCGKVHETLCKLAPGISVEKSFSPHSSNYKAGQFSGWSGRQTGAWPMSQPSVSGPRATRSSGSLAGQSSSPPLAGQKSIGVSASEAEPGQRAKDKKTPAKIAASQQRVSLAHSEIGRA